MTYRLARTERHQLAELLSAVGPDAPTLCAGWDAHDLAVHLRLRETNPLAAAGMLIKPLSGYLASRSRRLRAEVDFDELVGMIADGPRLPNPLGLPRIDERLNAMEYFVHHEDLRRAVVGWTPRVLASAADEQLWSHACSMARLRLGRLRIGVLLERVVDGLPTGERVVVATGPRPATITATGAELLLWLYGRHEVARIEFSGDDSSVGKLKNAQLSV
ncbi:TIGR03085 family protein [Propionibacterium sp. oral taxon 192 str. F0372]|uniref:TIGR03085 family metal-binding protein n=1 Tax=Propionibacterium sp. oral taxon 192 TaxID=671222 RepID=UPI0003533C76|nr:TIGR03085 family metal-binding protein [Propionibacterium sp. oral taxon 192]EPH03745.1 TIGR03085 family protein [Propionibacterium sp. oral taxon 192 str. F0372]